MRALVQRVSRASVSIDGEVAGAIDRGMVILLGVRTGDTKADADWLAEKCVNLRIFPDEQGNMNRSLLDMGYAALIVSQFTLYGNTRKGRRPSFVEAAAPELSEPLYEYFVSRVTGHGVRTATGRFGAMMQVALVNDGPVTLMVESP